MNNNRTIPYGFVQGTYWRSFAVLMGFSSVYLLGVGFTSAQIGILTALACVFSALSQPLVASYADSPRSPSLKIIVLGLVGCQLLLVVPLPLVRDSLVLTGLCYGAAIALLQLLLPLVNSLATETINQGREIRFGLCRGAGSAAYALMAYLMGQVQEKWGVVSIPVCVCIILLALLGAIVSFPFEKSLRPQAKKNSAGGTGYLWKKYPRFCILLLGFVLIYMSHTLLNNFTFQIVEHIGGGSGEMGVAMALCAVLEVPAMLCFGLLLKRKKVEFWVRMCSVFFALKAFLTLLTTSIPVFYAVQVLQPFGWGIMSVASVFYVNAIMEPGDAIKGQAYITMTLTLGTVLSAVAGGQLIDNLGVTAMLTFGTAVAILGAGINLFSTQKTD